jgi:hypothetical protein
MHGSRSAAEHGEEALHSPGEVTPAAAPQARPGRQSKVSADDGTISGPGYLALGNGQGGSAYLGAEMTDGGCVRVQVHDQNGRQLTACLNMVKGTVTKLSASGPREPGAGPVGQGGTPRVETRENFTVQVSES